MLIVAAVIATVMSTVELRPFLGTLASVGADCRPDRGVPRLPMRALVVGVPLIAALAAALCAPRRLRLASRSG